MSEIIVEGIRLSMEGANSFPLAVMHPDSPDYDRASQFFTVSLTNLSDRRKTLPFDELSRNYSRVYRNPATGEELFDNEIPPPKDDGSVEKLAPGSTKTFIVVFEYPEEIVKFENGKVTLQFCAKWEDSWLRKAAYKPGAYDWNESFELCHEIIITDDS